MDSIRKQGLVELHAHLGSSISPAVLWSIAHMNGIKLSTKDFWDFSNKIVLSFKKRTTLKAYLDTIYHPILDPLSSGTFAVEKAVHETLAGAYRNNNIIIHELRFNPMKHNAGGVQDLDHIIIAALRGMERAFLEYPTIQAGLIFCMDRQFTKKQNEVIAEKAIKYRNRGVVGVDFANYNKDGFKFSEYTTLIKRCKKNGLGTTVHTGETADTNDMRDAIKYLHPDRIGHGIRAAYDQDLLRLLVQDKIVLEICPLSNLVTKAVKTIDELRFIIRAFIKNNVLFTINTDWPETIENAHLIKQYEFLLKEKILSEQELTNTIKTGKKATFTKKGGLNAYL
jgi:adenosine deaminase